MQDTADTAIGSINKTASDAVENIGKAEQSINESVTAARGSADAAANSEQQAAASASAAQTSERNAANSAMQASQSATSANQSETNAAESERNAASSAEQAANVVASVSGSVSQAENAARSASQSATAAAGSASAAGVNAQAAAQSASQASASASAANTSETSAASSASAAKISETNAAASATAAQNAVNGFGLEVGTTTTGEPGTDASVEIQKQGTKYTANFTIPRGDKGEQATVIHDYTLTGDGTSSNPLRMIDGNFINAISLSGSEADANKLTANRIYKVDRHWDKLPPGLTIVGGSLLNATYGNSHIQCILAYTDGAGASIFVRQGWTNTGLANAEWNRLVEESEYNVLVNRVAALEAKLNDFAAIQTRLQALETRVESLENNQ